MASASKERIKNGFDESIVGVIVKIVSFESRYVCFTSSDICRDTSMERIRVSPSKSSQICFEVELDSATLSVICNHRSLPDLCPLVRSDSCGAVPRVSRSQGRENPKGYSRKEDRHQ